MLIKIARLCIVFIVCLITIQGCGATRAIEQSRVDRLEFELYKITSRLERLDTKIDMISWSMPQPTGLGRMVVDNTRQEQLEKLVVDLKTEVYRLNEQLSNSKSQP